MFLRVDGVGGTVTFVVALLATLDLYAYTFTTRTPVGGTPFLRDVRFSGTSVSNNFGRSGAFCSLALGSPDRDTILTDCGMGNTTSIFTACSCSGSGRRVNVAIALGFTGNDIVCAFGCSGIRDCTVSSGTGLGKLGYRCTRIRPRVGGGSAICGICVPHSLARLGVAPIASSIGTFTTPVGLALHTKRRASFSAAIATSSNAAGGCAFGVGEMGGALRRIGTRVTSPSFASFITNRLFCRGPIFAIAIYTITNKVLTIVVVLLVVEGITIGPCSDRRGPFCSPVRWAGEGSIDA